VAALKRLLHHAQAALVKRTWVIIGGLTGDKLEDNLDALLYRTPGNLASDQVEGVVQLAVDLGAAVFVKKNFAPMLQDMKEFPEGVCCQKYHGAAVLPMGGGQ